MKKGTNKTLMILGLMTVIIGFGNYLLNNGSLERILSNPQPEIIYNETITIEVSPTPELIEEATNSYLFEATVSGQTAFELLLSNIDTVEYTEYDFGTFVESINGIAGNNENFWAFYLNGEKAQSGADTTVLETGDQIEFIYEKIEF